MTKKAILRNLMLATGILAVLVILFSRAFQQETTTFLSKQDQKTEKAADTDKVIVAAPSEAITSSQAVEVGDTDPSLIREIILDEGNDSATPAPVRTLVSDFFKTLFRAYISPQAP